MLKQDMNEAINTEKNEFFIKVLNSGQAFDSLNEEDKSKHESKLIPVRKTLKRKNIYIVENLKIQEKINTKFFKLVETSDTCNAEEMLSKKVSYDRKPNINAKYLHDYTVLHVAVANNDYPMVELLLNYSCDIEAETSMKRKPLHIATMKANLKIIDRLVSCGAEINCRDVDNNTPLIYASRLGYEIIVGYFLYQKCDVSCRNNYGETAVDVVYNSCIYEIFHIHLGDDIEKYKSAYSRSLMNGIIFHNNRYDNITKILFYDQKIAKDQEKLKNIDHLSNRFCEGFPNDIDVESFQIKGLLGRGSFGEVYLVELRSNCKQFAMKVLDKKKILCQNIVRYVITERNVLSEMNNHPFIVKLYNAFQTDDFLYLILEYCEGKDLSYHLKKCKTFPEETVKIISAQILLAIEGLHKNNVIYRDLKPDNIVLDSQGFIKLTDFGLSKEGILDNTSAKSFCGSLAYLAPEMLNRQGHGKAVDWYLLGVLIYEMLVGVPPYYTKAGKDELFNNIKYATLIYPNYISKDAKSLISKLLNRNPNKRLGSGMLDAEEIKNHEFYQGIDFQKIYTKYFVPPYLKIHEDETLKNENENEKDNENETSHDASKKMNILIKAQNDIACKEIFEELKSNKKNLNNNIDGWTFIRNQKHS